MQENALPYRFHDAKPTWSTGYLWPKLQSFVRSRHWPDPRAFDLGCGNGSTSEMLHTHGFTVTGVDLSETGITQARTHYPGCRFEIGNVYDKLSLTYGTFPLVVSLEVIEHCMDPRAFSRTFLELIAPGGTGFLTTPYHSYLKNLALAASGKMDAHFTALWDGGHVKFFSIKTLSELLHEQGATDLTFLRAGRLPILAKSMICIVKKPE